MIPSSDSIFIPLAYGCFMILSVSHRTRNLLTGLPVADTRWPATQVPRILPGRVQPLKGGL